MSLVALSIAEREVGGRFEACALDRDRTERLEDGLARLVAKGAIVEAAVLATCARTELYLAVTQFHAAVEQAAGVLAEVLDVPRSLVEQLATVHFGTGALRHLYRVSAGMESVIIGESEIVAQVKDAIARAQRRRLAGGELTRVFDRALEVAKDVRASTELTHGSASVVTMATELALDGASARDVAVGVVGTGAIGSEVARVLSERGASVTVLTRRADVLSQQPVGVEVRAFEQLRSIIESLDAVVLATTTDSAVLDASMMPSGHPLRIVDLCRPRAADPALAAVDGVKLVDLEEVNELVAAQLSKRREALTDAELIIERALANDGVLLHAGELNPTLARLHAWGEALRQSELERALARVGDDEKARAALEELSHRLVRKVLHEPSKALRAHASSEDLGALLASVRTLFDL
ncbi:glutamyl-tRNA reductase [Acidimicrobium ferrooxidans DSM 10331]|uniref:Glutamyl-tRNA reductase n=1 Tax=Acidimicrobium ferrooxidans (strain DSM 10331 / JCM 15462 / NBRC 103882 / ICP) TaxID=525909 RepID=C7M2H4_ACIFD|nr:glutamyl-tRNA reductase [Acidimicrobium ferrooxidans]ACU53218.1 glutamyl-tRNA reductase [Acidimicrobium ferrooxidans DSM 10331]